MENMEEEQKEGVREEGENKEEDVAEEEDGK